MNKETLVNKLDNFLYDYDTYEYKDNEDYLGYQKEQIEELVRHHEFNVISKYLTEIFKESNDDEIKQVANNLIKDINRYQKQKSKDTSR